MSDWWSVVILLLAMTMMVTVKIVYVTIRDGVTVRAKRQKFVGPYVIWSHSIYDIGAGEWIPLNVWERRFDVDDGE